MQKQADKHEGPQIREYRFLEDMQGIESYEYSKSEKQINRTVPPMPAFPAGSQELHLRPELAWTG